MGGSGSKSEGRKKRELANGAGIMARCFSQGDARGVFRFVAYTSLGLRYAGLVSEETRPHLLIIHPPTLDAVSTRTPAARCLGHSVVPHLVSVGCATAELRRRQVGPMTSMSTILYLFNRVGLS